MGKIHLAVAWSVEEMRRGDIYTDCEKALLFRDVEMTDKLHHIGPYGDHWMVDTDVAWPVIRVFKQDRGDCEDPRKFSKQLRKKNK